NSASVSVTAPTSFYFSIRISGAKGHSSVRIFWEAGGPRKGTRPLAAARSLAVKKSGRFPAPHVEEQADHQADAGGEHPPHADGEEGQVRVRGVQQDLRVEQGLHPRREGLQEVQE